MNGTRAILRCLAPVPHPHLNPHHRATGIRPAPPLTVTVLPDCVGVDLQYCQVVWMSVVGEVILGC